ncbi:hypothetical protein PPL_03923 [Heterostelium album PN500]|uniref:Uncharacterized protein n=1 Tax=Heterostelium pallidum (strain ATCC 26659 / Pp 5 / PN500) TaxID=670386 RepID=D3B5I5_HETP5|nr:hypothetical protein PPL_03923 [Heterostelium album PN500]EFA83133.1 hypothetical protein PPL_03923 [Heterostelium album PN500]|eukprot:XP_020435250.1 hypothetical protein PPL_03923 [Heterostelium album PN500]
MGDIIKSYNNEENQILGCQHYPRNCMIKAECCGKWFVCRFCHNEATRTHEIDRFATKIIKCMLCAKEQPVGEKCIGCNTAFATYFCQHCKFYDSTPNKLIFHCDGCKICRVGNKNDFKHCFKCNGCLSASGFEKHKCLENKFENCPICLEDMFSSRDPPVTLKCGHALHESCYKSLLQSTQSNCPICKKLIYDDVNWSKFDDIIRRQPMPAVYRGSTCSIFCNDCEARSMDIEFHFLGNKCTKCGSYNTTILSKNMKIDENARDEPTDNNNNNNNNNEDGEDLEDDDDDEDEDGEEFSFVVDEEDDDDMEDEEEEDEDNQDVSAD